MNRPDLERFERQLEEGFLRPRFAAELVAYARHLERQLADEVDYINTQNEGAGKLLTQAQARISELEAALEFVETEPDFTLDGCVRVKAEWFLDAARVLRKGEQPSPETKTFGDYYTERLEKELCELKGFADVWQLRASMRKGK